MYSKSILKPGMSVKLRNGKFFFIVNSEVMLTTDLEERFLSRYDNELKVIGKRDCEQMPWDVEGVYEYNTKVKQWVLIPEDKHLFLHDDQLGNYFAHIYGRTTTVVTFWGEFSTTCLPEDEYSENQGITIAVLKAKRFMFKHKLRKVEEALSEMKK